MSNGRPRTPEEFVARYLSADTPVLTVPAEPGADGWPALVVRHGRYAAVLTFAGHPDHLCIDVYPFVGDEDARASVVGMESGRRVEGFGEEEAGGTSHQWPAVRMVAVMVGEQTSKTDGENGDDE